jgi:hypothetical protein
MQNPTIGHLEEGKGRRTKNHHEGSSAAGLHPPLQMSLHKLLQHCIASSDMGGLHPESTKTVSLKDNVVS